MTNWTQGDGSATDLAELADWRRQISTLYAEVRGMAANDPAIALAHWRAVRERLFREHPQSPVPPEARATFRARHFDHDPALRSEVVLQPAPPAGPGAPTGPAARPSGLGAPTGPPGIALVLPQSGGEQLAFSRIGRIQFPLPGGPRSLSVFWMAGYAGGLFIPFRDATNGTETYGAGRYVIDSAKSADLGGDPARSTLIIDFNFAFQPSCAFDPRFVCPLAPPENRLDVPIRAGERLA